MGICLHSLIIRYKVACMIMRGYYMVASESSVLMYNIAALHVNSIHVCRCEAKVYPFNDLIHHSNVGNGYKFKLAQ